jgi:NTP pyrophosphatase (non-canonical NTP hydrolase)
MDQIADLQKRIFQNKVEKGFNLESIETELLLITEELGEAVRAYRREGKKELTEEIVDIIIYCLGLLAILKVNASEEIEKKVKKNGTRTYSKVSGRGWGAVEKKVK